MREKGGDGWWLDRAGLFSGVSINFHYLSRQAAL